MAIKGPKSSADQCALGVRTGPSCAPIAPHSLIFYLLKIEEKLLPVVKSVVYFPLLVLN